MQHNAIPLLCLHSVFGISGIFLRFLGAGSVHNRVQERVGYRDFGGAVVSNLCDLRYFMKTRSHSKKEYIESLKV